MRRQGGYSGLPSTYGSSLTGSNYTSSYTPSSYNSSYKGTSRYGGTSASRLTSGYQSYAGGLSKSTNLPATSNYSSHISRRSEPQSRSYHPVTRSAERYSTTYGTTVEPSYRPSVTDHNYLSVGDSRVSRRDSLSDLSPYRTASNSSRQTLSSQYLTPSYQSRESSRESVLTRSWHSPARPAPQLEPRSYSYSNSGAPGRRNYSPSPLRYTSQPSTHNGGNGYSANISNSSQLYNSRDTINKSQERAESQIRTILNNITNYSATSTATGHRSRNFDSILLSPNRTLKENIVSPNYSSFKTDMQSSYMAGRYTSGLYSSSKPPTQVGRTGYNSSQLASSSYQPASTTTYSTGRNATITDGRPRKSRFLKPKTIEVKVDSDDDYDDSMPEASNDESSKRAGKETKRKKRNRRRLGLKPPDSPQLLRARKSSWESNPTATPSSLRSPEEKKSSSDEDFNTDKNSLEARIKARRKRLQKSKALLHGDQFREKPESISQPAYQSSITSSYALKDTRMQFTSAALRPDMTFSQTYTKELGKTEVPTPKGSKKVVSQVANSTPSTSSYRKTSEKITEETIRNPTFNYADYVSGITSKKSKVDGNATEKLDFSTLDDLNYEVPEDEEYKMKTAKQLIEEFSEREKQSKEAELARKKLQHQQQFGHIAVDNVSREQRRGTESPRFTSSSKLSVRSKNASMDIPVLVISSPKPTALNRDSKVYSSLERPGSKASSIPDAHKFHSLDRHIEAKVKVNLWEAGKSQKTTETFRHVTMPIEGNRVLTVDVPINPTAVPNGPEVLEHSAVVARKMEQRGQPVAAKIVPSRITKRQQPESEMGPTMIERVDQELLSLLTLGEEMESAHKEVYQQCKTAASLNRAQSLMAVSKPESVRKNLRTSLENLSSWKPTGSRESLNSVPKGWKKPQSPESNGRVGNGHISPPHAPIRTRDSRETSVVSQMSQVNSRGAHVSGRTSSLDIASQKIEEMLELARSKHQQEKQITKFIEAIEELDNIYQSLKTDENQNLVSQKHSRVNPIPERRKPEVSRRTDSYERLNAINYQAEVVMTSSLDQEKLNYTRKWLNDDLKSLTHDSRPDLLKFGRSPADFDQRSIGSASAEVAAICNKQKHPTPHVPDLLQQKKHSALLKPSPIQFAQVVTSTGEVRVSRHNSQTSLDSARKNVSKFVEVHKGAGPITGRLASSENLDNASDKMASYLHRKELGVVQKRVDQFEVKTASGDDESERSTEHRSEAVLSPRRLSLTDHIAEFITKFQPPDADVKIHSDDEARQYTSWRQSQKHSQNPGYAGSTVSLPTKNPVRVASDPRKLNVFYTPSKSPSGASPSGFYSAKGDLSDSHGSLGPFKDSHGSNVTLTDVEVTKPPLQPLKMDAMDAVDHLVAELELNTQEIESQKRSFPNDVRNTVDIVALETEGTGDNQQLVPISSARRVSSKPHLNAIPEYNEGYEQISKAQKMLENIRKNRKPNQDLDDNSHLARKASIPEMRKSNVNEQPSPSITPLSSVPNHVINFATNDRHSPFQIINEEKLCGDRLGQIKNVFEPIHSDNESLASSQRTARPPSQQSNLVRNQSKKKSGQTVMATSSPDLRTTKPKILPPTPVLAATTAQVSKALQQVEQVLASLDNIQIPKAPRAFQSEQQVDTGMVTRKPSVKLSAPNTKESQPNVFASSFYSSTNGHAEESESPTSPTHRQPSRNGLENGHSMPRGLYVAQPPTKECEYDNIIRPPTELSVNLNSPEVIKISNVVLGQNGGLSPSEASRNPIKNFLKRLKGVSGADKVGRTLNANDSDGFFNGSTLSLDQSVLSGNSVEPVDHRARIHKSNSSNESAYFSLHDKSNPSDNDKQELEKLLTSLHVSSESNSSWANHNREYRSDYSEMILATSLPSLMCEERFKGRQQQQIRFSTGSEIQAGLESLEEDLRRSSFFSVSSQSSSSYYYDCDDGGDTPTPVNSD